MADWWVRTDGGSTTRCTGHANAADPGSGTGQACAYSSIQDALTAAARGDTITIDLGTYQITAPLSLANKSGSFNGSNYITVQSSEVAALPDRRVSPSDAPNMPQIEITASGLSLTEWTGSGWKFDGLHLTNNLTTVLTSSDTTPAMIAFQLTASDGIIDRCLIHPEQHPSVANNYMSTGRYPINVGGNRLTVQRSYAYDFFGKDPTDALLQGVVSSQPVTGISNTNPAVIQYSGSPAVTTGDVVQVIFAGGGLDGRFRPGNALTGDFVATVVDATHFSVPVDLVGADTWDATNTRTAFYKWPRMSSVTLGSPTQITISQAPEGVALATGQKIRPHGLAGSLGAALNDNDYTITVINSTTFTIPVNTTSLSSYSGSGGYYKAEGSGQQTVGFGVGANCQDFTATNNYMQTWYATMQSAGSDASPTLTTTVLASPVPNQNTIYVADTTGIEVGMLIAADTTHTGNLDTCPNEGDSPCFGFGIVGAIDTDTGQIDFSTPLKIKNGHGILINPSAAILSPGQVNITGYNPTNLTMQFNTLDIAYDFAAFHYVSNGNNPKGLVEGKDATNFLAEGNIITGYPSSFAMTVANQNGSSPWMGNFGIIIRNNWYKAFRVGALVTFTDYGARTTQGYGVTIENNLMNGGVGYDGDCFTIQAPTMDVLIEHNTCTNGYFAGLTNRFTGFATGDGTDPYYPVAEVPNVIYRNNIADSGYNVAQCYIAGVLQSTFVPCFDGPILSYNGLAKTYVGSDPAGKFSTDPTNEVVANWDAVQFVGDDLEVVTDWALQSDSPFYQAGSDGSDMGVDMDQLVTALLNNDGFNSASVGTYVEGQVIFSGLVVVS